MHIHGAFTRTTITLDSPNLPDYGGLKRKTETRTQRAKLRDSLPVRESLWFVGPLGIWTWRQPSRSAYTTRKYPIHISCMYVCVCMYEYIYIYIYVCMYVCILPFRDQNRKTLQVELTDELEMPSVAGLSSWSCPSIRHALGSHSVCRARGVSTDGIG